MLPSRINKNSGKAEAGRRSAGHRTFVRSHACCACHAVAPIEVAHVRIGTDGGTGLKPSDKWCLSLCRNCHARQHQIGEASFEKEVGIDMKALAAEFLKASPHRSKLL